MALAEGKAEGRAATRHEIARRMLAANMSDAEIYRLTKLTKKELATLKKSLQ